MTRVISDEAQDDLLTRGYSRRNLARIAAVFGAGAGLAAVAGRPAWSAPIELPAPTPNAKVRIDKNECWTGPMAPGQAAATAILSSCNRYYPHNERVEFLRTVNAVEGVPADHVSPWPGSSDPLCRSIVTFCSPKRGLVTADPVFELAGATAEWLGAPVKRVPLNAELHHDVRAMLAADPNAGVYYVCSPNNPTGSVTPLADIEWLVANKPAGAMVVVDEAYIHFSGTPSACHMVSEGKDVIVLRTFSKVFGMAGMRMGYMMTRPDLIARMTRYDGGMQSGALPNPSLVCATASLTADREIASRRAYVREVRGMTMEHLAKRGVKTLPSEVNMFMIDWKTKNAREMQAAFRAQGVEIGRSWSAWPTVSRVTVGSAEDMKSFCATLDRIVA
jgi:histidinol-phosphate aminotransferase